MARKGSPERALAQLARAGKGSQSDPETDRLLMKARREFAKLIDPVYWHNEILALMQRPAAREEDPKVKLILAMVRILVPPPVRDPALDVAKLPSLFDKMELHVHADGELKRGTREARAEAIELERAQRAALEGELPRYEGVR